MISLIVIYAAVFVVGPLSYLLLLRPAPSRKQFTGLMCIVIGATGISFALRYLAGNWGQGVIVTLAGIGLIWVAWITMLAFVAQTLRKHDSRHRMRRWSAVIGALATTIPWFGLASAQMMLE